MRIQSRQKPDEELKARIARLQEKLGETNHGEN